MLEFRVAGKQDTGIIRDLADLTWPSTYVPIIGEEQVNYMLDLFYSTSALEKQMDVDGHHFTIAYHDEKPVGFSSVSRKNEEAVFRLHKLYLLPGLQGKGFGKSILNHAMSLSKELGGTKLELNVNRNNPALGFYKSQGFEIVSEEDISIGHGYFMNDFVMIRSL